MGCLDSVIGLYRFVKRQKHINMIISRNFKPALTKNTSYKQTLLNSKSITSQLIKNGLLNGCYLLMITKFYAFLLLPLMEFTMNTMFNVNYNLFLSQYIYPIMTVTMTFMWLIPVYLMSRLINILCHNEIANISYEQRYGKTLKMSLSQIIANTMFTSTLEMLYLVQTSLIHALATHSILRLLCNIHLSLLYALYMFDYKFCKMNWSIKQKITHLEQHWAYYCGFSTLIIVMLSCTSDYLNNTIVFALVFPFFIISAIESDNERLLPVIRLPIYQPALSLVNLLFRIIILCLNKLYY